VVHCVVDLAAEPNRARVFNGWKIAQHAQIAVCLILTHIWWNNIHRYRLNHFCKHTHTFTIADDFCFDLDYKKETRDKNAFHILTLLNYYYCV
jgi:hypothetical protein